MNDVTFPPAGGLLLFFALALPLSVVAGDVHRPSNYDQAVAQVARKQVVLSGEARESVERLKARFPAAVLAACAPTGSMRPALDENFIVLLEDCPFSRIGPGDVILTRLGSGAAHSGVMHRVVGFEGLGNVVTKGDALPRPDPVFTTRSNYLGKRVVASIHLETGVIAWLRTEHGR